MCVCVCVLSEACRRPTGAETLFRLSNRVGEHAAGLRNLVAVLCCPSAGALVPAIRVTGRAARLQRFESSLLACFASGAKRTSSLQAQTDASWIGLSSGGVVVEEAAAAAAASSKPFNGDGKGNGVLAGTGHEQLIN